jgi:hypothetical protein
MSTGPSHRAGVAVNHPFQVSLPGQRLPALARDGPPDLATMDFLYELGEIAAAGGDIRSRLFG